MSNTPAYRDTEVNTGVEMFIAQALREGETFARNQEREKTTRERESRFLLFIFTCRCMCVSVGRDDIVGLLKKRGNRELQSGGMGVG